MKISKNFKKSEVVIYAIALMLVTAGYFNYTTNVENTSTEIYSENIAEIEQNETKDVKENESKENEEDDIGDAKLVNSEVAEENNETDVNAQDSEKESENSEEQNSEEKTADNDYFVATKLERETNYATAISNYTKILEDNNVSSTEKASAMEEITKINNTKNAISVCENIISTKGFEKVVVLVNNKSVNIVVESQGLDAKGVAQIQNIISRELGTDIADIHITEFSKK